MFLIAANRWKPPRESREPLGRNEQPRVTPTNACRRHVLVMSYGFSTAVGGLNSVIKISMFMMAASRLTRVANHLTLRYARSTGE